MDDRWPFDSLSANFRRERTESENVAICGSGSGSVAISSCSFGMSERKPRKIFPFGPAM